MTPARHRTVAGLLLGMVTAASASQPGPRRDLPTVERQLAAARGAARIPLLLDLADLRRDEAGAQLRLADSALALLPAHPSVPLEIRARTTRSFALQIKGDYPAALAEALRAETQARATRDDSLLAEAGYHVALVEWRMARYPEALAKAESTYQRQAPRGSSTSLIRTLNLIGGIHHAAGALEAALERYLTAAEISDSIGDEQSAGRSRNNIGLIYWDLGRHEEALTTMKRALAIHERVGPRSNLANTLTNVGLIHLELKRPREAIPFLERSLALDRESGDRYGTAKNLSNLGWANGHLGETERAATFHQQALEIREAIGDKDGIVRSRGALAELALARGDARAAVAMLEQSTALARDINDRLDLVQQLKVLSDARARLGDTAGAYRTYRQYHELQTALADSSARQRTADLETRYRTRESERDRAAAEALADTRQRELRWVLLGSGLLGASLILLGVFSVNRSRAQRALAESEQRYRSLFQASVIPTFLIAVDSRRILDLNDPARALCGRDSKSEPPALADLGPEWVRRALDRALTPDGGDQLAVDDEWTDPSGRQRWTEIRGSAVSFDGRACRLVTVRDATELRAEEEARHRDDKLRSLGVLAGGIAHDFNNALTSILGHISLARVVPAEEQAEMLAFAEQAAAGASRLTGQLVAFAKGGQPLRRSTDVAPLLRNAVALSAAGSHLGVDFDLPADLWPAELDSGQFTQVVSNLVINAQQATGEGGRLLVQATDVLDPNPEATPESRRLVRIDFTDNGTGMPPAVRDRVFEPYFTTRTGGTGLGLATAFTICRNHGGRLTCESREGHGTTFSAFFPAASAPPPPPEATAGTVTPNGGGRILVLDDEPLVQNFLRRILAQWGYGVEVVADGRQAVERYVEGIRTGAPFHCLIMDLTIPGGMGGRQAMAEILSHDPAAVGIVASGYSDDPTIANYRAAGFAAALTKPFLPADLARTLAAVTRPDQSRTGH
ncbi:MAG: tetratricopeptide repeat protein [Gemmatimonadales bacterium]|nr:tetratricopeptide repeat protein [Gemmatimonadales bacterium]